MANEYAVNQADLLSVADAIREKGGTQDLLSFPAGFISAIESISGGGASLKVIAVSSKDALPETTNENTIAVITALKIGDVYAQAAAPETAQAGDVYIPTTGSLYTINIAESGALELKIGTPKIHDGDAWTSADMYIFLDGEWETFWMGALYEPGDTYTWLTGGFATVGAKSVSTAGVTVKELTVTEGADSLTAASSSSGSGTGGMLYTVNKIDLTGYTQITFTGTFKRGGSTQRNFNAAVWSDVYADMAYQDDAAAYATLGEYTSLSKITLPIDLDGAYHVGFGLSAGSSVVITSIVLS